MIHRIRRQILELDLPQERGARDMQQRASRIFQERVLPELDRLFSRIAPEGRIVRLERLVVDLGDMGGRDWEQRFAEQCIQQIAQQVTEAAFEAGQAGQSATFLSDEERHLDTLAHFLETGTIPWHAKGLITSELENMLIALPANALAALSRRLSPLLQRDAQAVQRLVQQFSPVFSEKIVAAVLGTEPAVLRQLARQVEEMSGQPLTPTQRAVMMSILLRQAEAPAAAPALDLRHRAQHLVKEMSLARPLPHPQHTPASTPPAAAAPAPAPAPGPAAPTRHTTPESQAPQAARPAPADSAQLSPKPSAPFQPQREPSSAPKLRAAALEGLVVEQAGLVVLAPYLAAFFEHLGLHWLPPAPEDLLPADAPATRAAHLLHHLATGEERAEEHRLILPKILCGIPLETALPPEVQITAAEKTEALNLLEAVIRNWPVLRNTSPDGLRAAFLHREGLLRWSAEQSAWVLCAERKAQDILLDKLPWTMSVVKLEWMPFLLRVEW